MSPSLENYSFGFDGQPLTMLIREPFRTWKNTTCAKENRGLLISLIETKTFPSISYFVVYCMLAWAIYSWLVHPRYLSPLRALPQPKGGYPLIGHSLSRFEQPLGQAYLRFMREVPNEGIILIRDVFNSEHLLLTSPEALAEVLVRKSYDFKKPPEIRQFTRRILGGGLLTAEGDMHKVHRKNVMPNFTLRQTKILAPLFWTKSVEMVKAIRADLDGNNNRLSGTVDMNHWCTNITLDIFGITALGLHLNILAGSEHFIKDAYEAAFAPTWRKDFLFVALYARLGCLVDCFPWEVDKQFNAATGDLRKFCWDAIQRSKQNPLGHDQKADLLSKMLTSTKFSDVELVEQFLTFLAAGHETVAATFGWVIYLLAGNRSTQDRLREELQSCPTDWNSDSIDDLDSLQDLPLLNGVCYEAIRLYPSVPLTPRVAVRPTTILNHPIRAGTRVMVAPCAINRAPHLWGPRANEFVPDRWIDPGSGQLNRTGGSTSPYSSLTFLHGPHSCIGAEYAKAELRAMTAAFVNAFKMEIARPKDIVIASGRLATRPGDKDGKLMIRLTAL